MGDRKAQRGATPEMEAESREWLVRCPACGDTRSIWDLGGVRHGARGTKMIFRRCLACHRFGPHLLYRERDGIQLPPLRPARPLWVYIGAFVAVIAIPTVLFSVGLILFVNSLTAGPRDAAIGYFAAVVARDWAGAHDRLGAAQRDRVSPQGLAATWAAREGTRGPVDGFRVTRSTRVSTGDGRALVRVTLCYRDGTTEPRTVLLVEEGGAWKIDSEP